MTNRLSHQCHRDGCDSESRWQACVRFFCFALPNQPATEMRCTTTVQVCDRHKRAASEFILSGENKTAIMAALVKEAAPLPNFETAEVVFIPIVDGRPVEDAAAA